jgi:hypothetical protein
MLYQLIRLRSLVSNNTMNIKMNRRSQCPRGLRRRSAAVWLLGVAGSNPARGMDVCRLCLYVVLFCVGRGLCDGVITRPEESYRVSVCVWSRNPEKGGQRSILDYKRLWMTELRRMYKKQTVATQRDIYLSMRSRRWQWTVHIAQLVSKTFDNAGSCISYTWHVTAGGDNVRWFYLKDPLFESGRRKQPMWLWRSASLLSREIQGYHN